VADILNIKGPQDRLRINVNEKHELDYWTKELGVTVERLRQLVHTHGVMADDIRRALGKSWQRPSRPNNHNLLGNFPLPQQGAFQRRAIRLSCRHAARSDEFSASSFVERALRRGRLPKN
jgi:Protein of unknown function (DUF3606)